MHFTNLSLTHFRNYPELEIDLTADVNCFTGKNGSGKTNILEAVHFLALTRGFGTDSEAARHGERFFMIGGYGAADRTANTANTETPHNTADAYRFHIQCTWMHTKGKKMIVDGRPLQRLSDHIGTLPLVSVLPEDTELARGGGSGRRKWLDSLLCQYDPAYLQAAMVYERALLQRNALLAIFAESHKPDPDALAPWDAQLCQQGAELCKRRAAFTAAFAPVFDEYYSEIASQAEQTALHYHSDLPEPTPEALAALLRKQYHRDTATGRTTAGPHRDDLVFSLDSRPIRAFGSQGQVKTYVTALKFAQYAFLARQTGRQPLLLLDDIFDKLDDFRVRRIAAIVTEAVKGQVFITDTSYERLREVFAHPYGGREIRLFWLHDRKLTAL